MRTITPTPFKVYSFDELSTEAKENALSKLYDLNVDYGWWENTYEDAAQVGIKIHAFDIYRGQDIDIKFIDDPGDVAEQILKDHGEQCNTYRDAVIFLTELKRLAVECCQDDADELCIAFSYESGIFDILGNDYYAGALQTYEHDDYNDVCEEFLHSLGQSYLIMLRNEYEYLTSEEAIIETIEANEYEFTEDGELY
jgi:hypothetical protein